MRANKDIVLFRIARIAYHSGLTPNMMTALGLALGVASGLLFALRAVPCAFAFGSVSVFCDALDGTLARRFHLESKFGLIFDSAADRITEFSVVIGALVGGIIEPLGVLAIIGSIALFTCRTVSYWQGQKTDYVWFGRFERLVLIFLGLLLPAAWASTLCFFVAGLLILISSSQIAVTLYKMRI